MSESTEVRSAMHSYVFVGNTVEDQVLRDSPAGDEAYFGSGGW